MKRLLVVLLTAVLAAAGLALADEPARPLTPEERLRQLRRDLGLVRQLVESGLRLAEEDDPLKRASQCNLLARDLARAAQQAVKDHDRARGDVLAHGLEKILVRGVADNLTRAADRLPPNSPSQTEVHRIGDEALLVMTPLKKEYDRVPSPKQKQMKNVLRALTKGRAMLEAARAKFEKSRTHGGKSRWGLKAPPFGKKKKHHK